ncbi:MAG: hemolysin-coregulated protein [Candidatus Peribacter riflensis]|uniref:Hemolysin-coregulated protein n=1 Tax=Candidatus Peribacter riflensis TaxID=1735162 RepID=A0A0S1SU77_9BACT|nr:MAG: hemolysin-coregulated protein [Candidatus Peribacter riflensis]ALM11272.1 MAG: hemolysin-coregulated protein [Candidatus Peribacter riflensis]ALM12374.1 MAG: hemolysin-coregulated protein [Candidatus Peribacter riflensis]ALM13476.1 MAG: hemolysin-coregulated protein [Candidatus Peribacter riflensis]ALM14575.1 MAG: hemolysin-coregulated protein [Candidatus Peribacter riflensis]
MFDRSFTIGQHFRLLAAVLLFSALMLLGVRYLSASAAQSTLGFSVIPVAAAASSDYYLKLDGIEGESASSDHRGEIDIQSFSWGVSQMGTGGKGGGSGAGKVSFQDLHFTKRIDKSSPLLMKSVASGKHIAKAVLTGRSADGRDYLVITLSDVMVSSFVQNGDGSDVPAETLSFTYAKIEFEYRTQDGAVTKASWDLKANKGA